MSINSAHLNEIIKVKPRERGGTIAANRQEYQRNWTLCYLLRIHDATRDYTILLDYHDDVVAIDNTQDLKAIDFFQIKTDKSSKWTLATLLKRKKDKEGSDTGYSICGKMYANKMAFPDRTRSLNFISNSQFNIPLDGEDAKITTVDEFEITKLKSDSREELAKAIQSEFGLPSLPQFDVSILFRRDTLNWDGHDKQAIGELVEYLDKRCPDGQFAAKAAFKALAQVILQKTSCERLIEDPAELVRLKGITRCEFEGMIEQILRSEGKDSAKRETEILRYLQNESFPLMEVKQLQREWRKYTTQRIDVANPAIYELKKLSTEAIKEYTQNNSSCTIRQVMEGCTLIVRGKISAAFPFDENYIKAAVLVEFYESE
jgi:hypothetical protein